MLLLLLLLATTEYLFVMCRFLLRRLHHNVVRKKRGEFVAKASDSVEFLPRRMHPLGRCLEQRLRLLQERVTEVQLLSLAVWLLFPEQVRFVKAAHHLSDVAQLTLPFRTIRAGR